MNPTTTHQKIRELLTFNPYQGEKPTKKMKTKKIKEIGMQQLQSVFVAS